MSPSAERLRVDRIACTGHGVCAQLLTGRVELDEWGYPVLLSEIGAGEATAAVRLCPARALYLRPGPS